MTGTVCLALGIIIGGAVVYFFDHKTVKEKEQALNKEIQGYHRVTTQLSNFLNYDGTSFGQEDVD